MIAFPNAKINLGLNIVERRKDNFHNIETIFYPVPWNDILEIIPSDGFSFDITGIPLPGSPNDNLCAKVLEGLKSGRSFQNVKMHLHKLIPAGAGLGGGSSDAAFTVKMLDEIFQLNLSLDEMEEFVSGYGSDCAFFIRNKPVFASGKGSIFESVQLSLAGKWILLIYPGLNISTKEAYEGVSPAKPLVSIREIVRKQPSEWRDLLVNDFEKSLFPKYPVLKEIKEQLYSLGATYASMSGSGSTVYGIFDSPVNPLPAFPDSYKVQSGFLNE